MPASPLAELHVVEHAARHGGPAAGVVVLVHGSLDRGSSFARVERRLDDLHVVSYDRRGYGRSRHEGQPVVGFDRHVEDLLAVVADRRVAVVGHSFGGVVALAAAARAPERILAVGAYEPPAPWLLWWPRRARTTAESDPGDYAEGFFRRMVGDGTWDRLPEAARTARRAEGPTLMVELADIRGERPPFDIGSLRVPVVLARGGATLPRHQRAVGELAGAIGDCEVVDIPRAGHGAHLSHPGAFAEFCRRVVSAAGAHPDVPDGG